MTDQQIIAEAKATLPSPSTTPMMYQTVEMHGKRIQFWRDVKYQLHSCCVQPMLISAEWKFQYMQNI